ncbi:RTA1 domain protein, putative [Talaromyces stipitatus ATCC 10500]|uniref:RTA1 domain protein, putative n=1 Tax=Talaromyces stipitatus (strain ATCC 10500 / CBS 375.48 / QM 6759 / NRRL 1006) TaxID=441959 RepID=B8MQD4_TALSN|nr:RTA1 domain protein, putative [Talaromyces stipitatus ATCC 10500]EED13336.1 RTA1 domain protein, putative [Talaromyces stipitatus ATCC 10500]
MGRSIYFYEPSLAAAIIFTILYMLSLFYQAYVAVIASCTGKYNQAGYFIPILIGAATEVAAYAIRAASVKKPDDVGLYATSATLIVIAPVLVCACLFLTQASGSGIASSNNWTGSSKDAGIGVLIGGLVLQLVTFVLFLVLVIWYNARLAPLREERRVPV